MDGLIWQFAIKWGRWPIASFMGNGWIALWSQNILQCLKIFVTFSKYSTVSHNILLFMKSLCEVDFGKKFVRPIKNMFQILKNGKFMLKRSLKQKYSLILLMTLRLLSWRLCLSSPRAESARAVTGT